MVPVTTDSLTHLQTSKLHLILSIINSTANSNQNQAIIEVERWLDGLNVEISTRTRSGRSAIADIYIEPIKYEPLIESLKSYREGWFENYECDVNICYSEASDVDFENSRNDRLLFVFDFDSTLIQMETIDEIARIANVYDKVSLITERSMRGELDFKDSLKERVSWFRGLDSKSTWSKISSNLPVTKGVEGLFTEIQRRNHLIAIISGGFTKVVGTFAQKFGITEFYANDLEEDENGTFTGSLVNKDSVVDAQVKMNFMRDISTKYSIPLERVIAVGDGANDLPMLQEAGIGIAFCAKPILRQRVPQIVNLLKFDHPIDCHPIEFARYFSYP